MQAAPTTAESLRLLASMLVIAEKQKDRDALTRYINKVGTLMNQLVQEAASWPSAPQK